MNDIVARAADFATRAHGKQARKYTGVPYIEHPRAVVEIVKTVPHDDAMLAAAWMHDVMEDCGISYATMVSLFGEDIANLVDELTDVATPSDGPRAVRAALNRHHLMKASPRAKTIKLADMIDNMSSIVQHDPDFANIYLYEKKLALPLLAEGEFLLFKRAADILLQWEIDRKHREFT